MAKYNIDIDENKFKWVWRWRNLFIVLAMVALCLFNNEQPEEMKTLLFMLCFLFFGMAMSAHLTTLYLIGAFDE